MNPAKTMPPVVRPGDTIGVLGGGQLGRMLAAAAAGLGLDVHVFTPEADSPASRVARRTWVADYDDEAALAEFACSTGVVTIEFENIPASALRTISRCGVPVRPGETSLSVSQDRLEEKNFFTRIGIPPAPFERIDRASEIGPALARLGGHGVLKTRRSGYDGKGQVRISSPDQADAAFAALSGAPSILEAFIPFEREISVILARGADGAVAAYDPPDNTHENGVLRRSRFPSQTPALVQAEALASAARLAEALGHVGVLALEFFLTTDGRLLANEFAPRVHNSGHWTSRACRTGQFEQHIRAVCGWPLGDPFRHSEGEMENLLGEEVFSWQDRLSAGEFVELYGKRSAPPGRKMGHVTRFRPAGG